MKKIFNINTNKQSLLFGVLTFLVISMSSCQVVEGIFKAGFWSAILLIALIIGVVVWLASRGK